MKILYALILFVIIGCHHRQDTGNINTAIDKQCSKWFNWCVERDNQICQQNVMIYCENQRNTIKQQELEEQQKQAIEDKESEDRKKRFLKGLSIGLQRAGCSLSGNCIMINPVHCTTEVIDNKIITDCQ